MDTGRTVLSSPAGLQGHYSGTNLPGCVSRLSNPFGNKEDHHISSPLAASPGRLVLPTSFRHSLCHSGTLTVQFGHSPSNSALTVHFDHSLYNLGTFCAIRAISVHFSTYPPSSRICPCRCFLNDIA